MPKQILFSTEMVRAILDGKKSVTRRLPPKKIRKQWFDYDKWVSEVMTSGSKWFSEKEFYKRYPPYKTGDVMYVRETWSTTDTCGLFPPWPSSGTHYIYRSDAEPDDPIINEVRWHPSIHMPRKAARIFLRATDVRMERLKDMTSDSAMDEGFMDWNDAKRVWNSTIRPSDLPICGWDANPWVWVIEFERCEKTEAATA